MRKIFSVLILLFLVIGGYLFYSSRKDIEFQNSLAREEPHPSTTPTPTPARTAVEVHSPDGKMRIAMRKTVESSGVANYSFSVYEDGSPSVNIFSKTLSVSSMEIPANSFSPDNNYLFIRENDATESSYFVFKTTGDNFLNGDKYIDVSKEFSARVKSYSLKETTGWDSPGLLHVLTNGPSFWFELSDRAFLQLATK